MQTKTKKLAQLPQGFSVYEDTFHYRINKDGPIPSHVPEIGKCWLWTGGTNDSGYGTIWGFKAGKRHLMRAHRVSWFIHKGDTLKDNALHKCDNRKCVNPEHLFDGTKEDNMRDMISKGRANHEKNKVFGTRHASAKLNPESVLIIRNYYATGLYRLDDLARMFSVDRSVIWAVVKRRTWKHVA